ncbi:MAG: phosphodiesterase [Methylobacterium sp.]|jgi:3',5'-cyclic AMP phosphodiesterase CpdA|nr:phosphodiesterase [Methylobacterium sp.]MCA3627966.1 phosphodiesterase [Methylobacterium sp.]
MSKPDVVIAQITDLHIKRRGELAYGKVDTAAGLERLVQTLNLLRPEPHLIVISGDLVDAGRSEEYLHLRKLLEPLRGPLMVVPGNHDNPGTMREAFPDQPFQSASSLNQIRQVGHLDIVGLDSSVPGQPHGELDAATLSWLDATLAADHARPALLFLHHPPFRMGVWHMDRQNLANADALSRIVIRHPRVALVAAGHCHRSAITRFAGTLGTICPAPSHAVALDLDQAIMPSFTIEPPAFHLHIWSNADQSLLTHHVPVGDFDGPHPFFGADGRLL